MAYLYRHIRLDKNVPFYIGIGSDDKGEYKRAYQLGERNRNSYWNRIVAKGGYEVEIVLDNITWEEACKKEIEFISLYKRKRDGGTLANLTLGGEGQLGMIGELNGMFGKKTTDETKAKQRIQKLGKPSGRKGKPALPHVMEAAWKARRGKSSWNKGIPVSEEQKERQRQNLIGKLAGDKHPNFGKKMPDHVKEKLRLANIGKPVWNKGKKGEYKTQPSKLKKSVFKYDLSNNFLAEYDSATDAAKQNNCKKAGVSWCCLGNIKFHHGFIWKYK